MMLSRIPPALLGVRGKAASFALADGFAVWHPPERRTKSYAVSPAAWRYPPTDITERRTGNMPRSKCEFHGQIQAKAEAKLNEWKKANAKAVSIIAQIIETSSTDSDACVIRVEYENSE